MKKLAPVLIASVAVVVGACSSPPPAVNSAATAEFKRTVAAPADSARVYILPTLSKGMFTDPEGRAGIAIFNDGSERGAPLAWTAKQTFVAFDIPPGTYDLMAYTDGSFTKFTKSMTFANGSVSFLRPTFFRSARELSAAGSGAAAPNNGMGFEPVPLAIGVDEIGGMAMAELAPEGQAFLAQARTRPSPPQSVHPPAGPAQPAAPYAPPPAQPPVTPPVVAPPTVVPPPVPVPAAVPPAPPVVAPLDNQFRVVEQKLKDLRRLRQEGLITKEEYDGKRRAILDAY